MRQEIDVPRLSSIEYLSPIQRLRVDSIVRSHGYAQFEHVQMLLVEEGIKTSRSALHRYATKLKERDGRFSGEPDRTVVVLFDKETGGVTTLTSTATVDVVIRAISGLANEPGNLQQSFKTIS